MKMILAFGIVFQLPVVLMFLAWIGVVTTRMLKQNWRYRGGGLLGGGGGGDAFERCAVDADDGGAADHPLLRQHLAGGHRRAHPGEKGGSGGRSQL